MSAELTESYDVEGILFDVMEEMISSGVLRSNFTFREGQLETILHALDSFINKQTPTVILDAPTGTGKSVIARIIAEAVTAFYGGDALFLTETIALQNQYIKDYPTVKKLMGATNYPCHAPEVKNIPATHKVHGTCRHTRKSGLCNYQLARDIFNQSAMKILNYKFYMTAFGKYNSETLLVCDEAHTLGESFIEMTTIRINYDTLESVLNDLKVSNYVDMDYIKKYDNEDPLNLEVLIGTVKFLDLAIQQLDSMIFNLETVIENFKGTDEDLSKMIENNLEPLKSSRSYCKNMMRGLTGLFRGNLEDYVIYKEDAEEHPVTITVRPVTVKESGMGFFSVPKFRLLMTATPFNLARDLKLPEGTFEVIHLKYLWPLENRPVVIADDLEVMNYRNKDELFPEYMTKLDSFIDEMGDVRGLIHSSSYDNAYKIVKASKHKKRMIVPETADIRHLDKLVKQHPNCIIVSPAVLTGVDLPDDMCRFQIFFKLPYPHLGDKYVAYKKDVVDGWYEEEVAKMIIQGTGRAIRGPDDYAITYVMDKSIRRVLAYLHGSVPSWFMDTLM